ncbi:transglycosylase SLT domain-containing protein [Oceanibaculum indicum]|uniref:Transglycosylase-like protein with SLT domain n=1 Tax=Oceanibaculum indicum TaxID=526216 RepID=A0A420WQH4_9PROT|nr:transglycosylase SLT domain-containing protein [Oceanibaculum indicum]RKQ73112.1 transglycosylase-like protein with SLT domain [Oceanibaculum indicum]
MSAARQIAVLAGLAGLFAVLSKKTLALPGAALPPGSVGALAVETVNRYFGGRIDPMILAAMAKIESGNNPLALRFEPHLPDYSVGLMQTLVGTAQWLWRDMGYRALPEPDAASLTDAATSMYFGAAYVDWLSNYRGVRRSEQWIVESYNGGPGNSNSQTRNHWQKYLAAKAALGG